MCKEYGGYLALDEYDGEEYHGKSIALNCGRNALAYLIESKNIKRIHLPYFLCESVSNVCSRYNLNVEYYRVDARLRPVLSEELCKKDWVCLVNYYGQLKSNEILNYKRKYPNLILDNAQAFFEAPLEQIYTLYSCRKFFGVPDGAYLYTDDILNITDKDCSYERMHHLLGRFEKGANQFYSEYVQNNKLFAEESIKEMSKLTHNLLRGLNYKKIAETRERNFKILCDRFSSINKLDLAIPKGAYMYPLYVEDGERMRQELQRKKIYVPILWPDVLQNCAEDSLAYDMALNILPLPVDQRYEEADMVHIAEEVLKCIN